MAVYNVALGVDCGHCHSSDWKVSEKTAHKKVALMSSFFDVFPKFVPKDAVTQCYMCHKGTTKPGR